MPLRWLIGVVKVLVGLWDASEAAYHTRTGLDPKIPAYERWAVRLKDEALPPRNETERVVPVHNYTVVLQDKFGRSADDVVLFTQLLDQAQTVEQHFERELRSRTSGDFWHGMIMNRRLDYQLTIRPTDTRPLEGEDVDEEQMREFFRR